MAKRKAENEKQKAENEKQEAENEKQKAESSEQKAESTEQEAESEKQKADKEIFSSKGRDFEVTASAVIIPKMGKFSKIEIYNNPEAQAKLVDILDKHGSGVIREVFS